mmetsp:Transcript_2563/g.2959  ORF Transcript_2563/g.2959 Transcript_2563/m.2959 type:complete len:89 (-) Transcript_2563:366-632(-)
MWINLHFPLGTSFSHLGKFLLCRIYSDALLAAKKTMGEKESETAIAVEAKTKALEENVQENSDALNSKQKESDEIVSAGANVREVKLV